MERRTKQRILLPRFSDTHGKTHSAMYGKRWNAATRSMFQGESDFICALYLRLIHPLTCLTCSDLSGDLTTGLLLKAATASPLEMGYLYGI